MRIFENILGFLSRNKKNIFYIFLFIVVFFHLNDFALAGGGDAPVDKEKTNTFITVLNKFLAGVSGMLALLTMLIGLFLRPEWTSGSVIGLDTQLKTLWILVSNIVYLVFAGIFVTIAFMNIIGHGDHYELKKAIPKFIVGVLIVPFSWFFVQFILSLSSILTVAVLSLPYDTFPSLDLKNQTISSCSTDGYKINIGSTGAVVQCKQGEPIPKKIGDFIKEKDNAGLYSIMHIYTYGVMKLDDQGKLSSFDLQKGVTDIWSLGLKGLFDLVFVVVYLLLLVALFLAFMVRGIALWFYIMFSPLFGLLHFFGHGKDGMGDGPAKKFNLTEFIGLAFVPVYVAAALSFGVLFLFVAGKGFSESAGEQTGKYVQFKGDDLVIGNNVLSADAIKSSSDKAKSSVFSGFTGPIGALFLEMLGLAVLWVAVMAALHQSKITEGVSGPISHFGDEIGKLVAKAPTYAPILPGGLSAQGLSTAGGSFSSAVHNEFTGKGSKFGSEAASKFGFGNKALSDLRDMLQKNYNNDNDKEKGMRELLNKIDATQLSDKTYREALGDVFKKLGATDNLGQLIKTEGTSPEMLARILDQRTEKTDGTGWEKGPDGLVGKMFRGKTEKEIVSMFGGGNASTSSSSSTLPSTIAKTQNGDNITVNVTKLDGLGKATSDKVDVNINKGKLSNDDLSKLGDVLKTHKGEYNINEFKKILADMGITDQSQIDKLVKIYLG